MKLEGKVGFVTGAGSGIGRATVRRFNEEGARVVAADVDLGAAQDAVRGLDAAVAAEMDVTDLVTIEAALRAAVERFRRVDIVVNSAGVLAFGAAHELNEAEWDRCFNINLKGTYLVAKAAWPHLLASGGGSIVNLASIFGMTPVPADIAYCASKAAVIMLTRCMALDGATEGIRVNCVSPGYTLTPMTQAALRARGNYDAAHARAVRLHPIGRLGEPADIASAIAYLASDDAEWVTGTNLLVDGGFIVGLGAAVGAD